MDAERFDRLATMLGARGTRRGLPRLVTALALASGVLTRLGGEVVQGQGNGAGVGGGHGRRHHHHHHHHHHRHHHPGDTKGQHHERSRLICPSGLTNCGGVCTNLQTDAAHCGSCGNGCTAHQLCLRGVCFPTDSCPATTAQDFCLQREVLCSPPGTQQTADMCSCARSLEGDVVCVNSDYECSFLCASSAECAPGQVCVDLGSCCTGNAQICMTKCADPTPA